MTDDMCAVGINGVTKRFGQTAAVQGVEVTIADIKPSLKLRQVKEPEAADSTSAARTPIAAASVGVKIPK